MNRLNIIHEVYFGKTSEVLKIEYIIQQLKSKYDNIYRNIEINADPLKIKLEDAFCEAFGFGSTDIRIINTTEINAMTMPIGWKLDTIPSNNLVIHNKNGFKFKKEADYSLFIIIYTGLLLNPNITPAEITAILLHEVGHNFTPAVFLEVGIFQKMCLIPEIIKSIIIDHDFLSIILTTNYSSKISAKINRKIETEYKPLSYIYETLESGFKLFKDTEDAIYKLLQAINPLSLITAIPRILLQFLDPYSIAFGNGDENNADKFAAMYGYGPELTSGLEKMQSPKNRQDLFSDICKICPIISYMYELSSIPIKLAISPIEQHSESCVRAVKTLDYLEYELNHNNYSPKIKTRIKHDIIKTKKVLDKYKDFSDGIEDPGLINKLWAQIVLKTKCYRIYEMIFDYATPETIDLISKEKISEFDKIKFK